MRNRAHSLRQRLWNPRALLVLGALTVFAVGSALITLSLRNQSIDHDIALLEGEARSLESRNLELVELLRRFETSGFLEREARLKLNLQKPGETVVIVEREARTTSTAHAVDRRRTVGNPERWWRYFFDPAAFTDGG